MRIVGGELRGRSLHTPRSQDIRPTSDRLREALFNILAHHDRIDLHKARVLDVFAGTGALGIEALSRGAGFALFIEESAEGRGLVRQNVMALGLQGCTKVYRRDATKPGKPGTLEPFNLAFLDPPYGKGLGEKALEELQNGGWFKPGALVILEEMTKAEIDLPADYELLDERIYGDTKFLFLAPEEI